MMFFISFYLPLRYSMAVVGYDYAQYFLPVIVVQGMFFTAVPAARSNSRGVVRENGSWTIVCRPRCR